VRFPNLKLMPPSRKSSSPLQIVLSCAVSVRLELVPEIKFNSIDCNGAKSRIEGYVDKACSLEIEPWVALDTMNKL
jgi:hypothetical protein